MKRFNRWFSGTKGKLALAVTLTLGVVFGLIDAAVAALIAGAALVTAIESQGITLQYTVGSPTNMAGIANVVGFSGPGGSASVIDTTNLSSTAKEKLMGLPDEGQFTMDLNFDPDAASHIALRSARSSRTRTEFKITFTDATPSTATFSGFVLGFQVQGSVDAAVKASVTIEIDGAVVWA